MKKILLLGASGSIGQQTIDVIKNHLDQYELTGFSVGKQVDKALAILKELRVAHVYVKDAEDAANLLTGQVQFISNGRAEREWSAATRSKRR